MVQKRQLAEEEYDVSPKHLKLEHSCELVPFLQLTKGDAALQSDKDESCFSRPIIGVDYGFVSGKFTDLPMCTTKDVDYTLPGSLSTSSWASCTTSEEDVRAEAPRQTPDYSPLKPRMLIQPEDAYSYLLGRPPLKEVPIGPEYQADIPEWRGYDAQYASLCSGSSKGSSLFQTSEVNGYGEDEIKFMGSCVIPMPEDPTIFNDDTIGRGRTDCYCENPGSLGCVQRHIKEAREILERNSGHERVAELGFGNMGEVVADRWTEEDEQLFHEVVYSNPVSFGRNFWDHLAEVFPSRTNQEIVSYYFNVFVLRRRAEQNRCDPMNVDSDDDEWRGSDTSDEEDYSCQDEIHKYDSYEHGSGIESPIMVHYRDVGIPHDQLGSANFSGTQPRKLLNSCSFDSTSQPSEKTMVDESGVNGDHDFQDDSCTSSDTGGAPRESEVNVDCSKSWGNHEFIFEPSDSKVWDVGYFACPRTKTDFLPTGSMIEEVFGVGSWNFEVTDDDKSSN